MFRLSPDPRCLFDGGFWTFWITGRSSSSLDHFILTKRRCFGINDEFLTPRSLHGGQETRCRITGRSTDPLDHPAVRGVQVWESKEHESITRHFNCVENKARPGWLPQEATHFKFGKSQYGQHNITEALAELHCLIGSLLPDRMMFFPVISVSIDHVQHSPSLTGVFLRRVFQLVRMRRNRIFPSSSPSDLSDWLTPSRNRAETGN